MKRQYRTDLLIALIRRRIIEKYVGSAFGLLWVLLVPLIPLLTNLLIFFYIAKIPQVKEMGVLGYSIYIFSGLLPYRIFQKCLAEASELLITNMELLKNVIFPLPFLGMTALGAILFEFCLQIIVLFCLLLLSEVGIHYQILILPAAMILLSMLILGCIWITSILGYLLKDIQEIVNVIFLALIYITPTMYPPDTAPRIIQELIKINPLSHMVIVFRDVWLPGTNDFHLTSWAYFTGLSLLVLTIGYLMILKVKKIVGDLV